MTNSPPFGQADLSNCERELIHLAGSVQPHGALLVLRETDLRIVQLSANVAALLGRTADALLERPLAALGGDVDARVRALLAGADLAEPVPLRCTALAQGAELAFEGSLHRAPDAAQRPLLLLELEPVASAVPTVSLNDEQLIEQLDAAVARLSSASTIGTLADAVVRSVRDLVGYDRVMVYKFDPEGHGKIIAEARDPRLESLLGHHYPASDIPQRARELYLRNRVRVLVDVHYAPAPLHPARLPDGSELDMSLCQLRSMSPLHLQYLKNMGVTATLVVSLVREGQLWGLIACHHYSPRKLRSAVRAAADLLAEVVSTRIAAIEHYAHAQVAIQVRRLEQRLVEATSTEGDWRLALFRNPRTLLQPLDATGAALFHDGELLTAGEVPSTPELRALLQWIAEQPSGGLFSCSSVGRANPALDSLTPTASGVLAVRLSTTRPDYLAWFRKEQLLTVTWAGDPSKPVVGDDPLELSPRRSFAAWSEIVRGTALPWSTGELALAGAFGKALIDIIVQVNAVRLLIAEHQLAGIRATVASSVEPIAIADAQQRLLLANAAFERLTGGPLAAGMPLAALADRCAAPAALREALTQIAQDRQPWRGELTLQVDGGALPVGLRAELVPGRDGVLLGFFLILTDLSGSRRAEAARTHLEQSLSAIGLAPDARDGSAGDGLVTGILANASLAAMDIADGNACESVAELLEDLEASTRRATALYGRLRALGGPR